MKKITFGMLACLMIFASCNHDIEQLFDRERNPVAPVLTIEGSSHFVITDDLPDFYYTVLTWSRANFGKGVSANYTLLVSYEEDFSVTTLVPLGTDVYLRALSASELFAWVFPPILSLEPFDPKDRDPMPLYFRIMAEPVGAPSSAPVYSNVEAFTSQWKEDDPWEPVDLKIYFKVTSGDWDEYAVYAWGDDQVYGDWPGLKLDHIADGWYSFTVPTNRPINLIMNNNGKGRQFDFLKDADLFDNHAFEFAIHEVDNNSCVWTEVEIPQLWIPVDLDIYFKPVSGDWGEYAVYAWGDAQVYGDWPGLLLEPNEEGWYTFVVPTNRPINLIINNNGNGRQFDFLKDDDLYQDQAFEFAIHETDNNSCVWTKVEIPSGEPALYIIGDEFGGWDWSSAGVVEMTPVNGYEGHFWAIRHITAGKGFKWCPVRAWSGDFYSLGENIGYTVSGGNAYVAQDGVYMIYVDMENGKISVEPARVYGIGPCFGAWDTNQFPFEEWGTKMTRTTVGNGELRLYAASDISPVGGDWWRMEFVVLDGKIAYRGKGGDQERVQVSAGTLVILDFNSGTGTFE